MTGNIIVAMAQGCHLSFNIISLRGFSKDALEDERLRFHPVSDTFAL